ncbi:MarR family winged helix-turn-helix transcriptional regulator [Pseudorhodoplanes sp.]|uniref:MarR family winged helix-turn-helix transcriptional regulator n=1 Tax=Pseudorhodoplanes sp. TaxID=1934341 RepID=UPI003918756A
MARSATRPAAIAETSPEPQAADSLDFGPFDDWIGFRLRMAQIASFQSFARHTQSVGLSPGRFAALILIDRNPGMSQTALARAIGSDKSTLTPVLDDLVKRGLISRTRTRSDRRLYELSLTDAGRKVVRAMQDCAERHERELDDIVGPRDRAQFVRILRKISTALG